MPSLAELEAFVLQTDRERYDLTAIRLANPESRRNQLSMVTLKLSQLKIHSERQWTLFYLLRLVGSSQDWMFYEGLLVYLNKGDYWIDGLDIAEYLREIDHDRFNAVEPRYKTLQPNWICLAEDRLAARWAAKAREIALADELVARRVAAKKLVKHKDTVGASVEGESITHGAEADQDEVHIKPKVKTQKRKPHPPETLRDISKRQCTGTSKKAKIKTERTVPDTLWTAVVDEQYYRIIDAAGTGHVLPPCAVKDFSADTGPHDWPQGDTMHWFGILQEACANIKVLTLPLTYAELVSQAVRQKQKDQNKYTPEEVMRWEEVVKEWDAATAKLPQIKGNAIIKTIDGEVVLYKLDDALKEGWGDPELGAKFVSHLTDSLETLRKAWNGSLPLPGIYDTRHHALEEMRSKYGSDHVGVWHFAFWCATGMPHRGPHVSTQCLGHKNVWRFQPATRFLEAMAPWQQAAAILFRLLEPTSCKRYKNNFDNLARKYTSMHAIRKTPRMTFLGLAIPFQVRVLPHKDNADDKQGWVAMTNLGDFQDGDLVVGSDGTAFRFEYQPGQFVLMKSALLRHGVMPFEGTRRALVLFSHEKVFAYGSQA